MENSFLTEEELYKLKLVANTIDKNETSGALVSHLATILSVTYMTRGIDPDSAAYALYVFGSTIMDSLVKTIDVKADNVSDGQVSLGAVGMVAMYAAALLSGV